MGVGLRLFRPGVFGARHGKQIDLRSTKNRRPTPKPSSFMGSYGRAVSVIVLLPATHEMSTPITRKAAIIHQVLPRTSQAPEI